MQLGIKALPEALAIAKELDLDLVEVAPMANHCYGIFELATIYLSHKPPMLFEARLAIDGLGALLNGVKGRLGEAEPSLLEALSQLQLAFVQLEGAERAAAESAANSAQN